MFSAETYGKEVHGAAAILLKNGVHTGPIMTHGFDDES